MKKYMYVFAVIVVIATLVISSTASIPLLRNTSISNNNVGTTETSAAPMNDNSFVQRLKRLLTGEIIDIDISDSANINPSKINSSTLTSMDITTGNIPYNENPPYSENIGFTIDVSSKIPSGFSLIEVSAKGRKTHLITGEIQDEPPLILYPIINGTNIEIQVWDANGYEYGGTGWSTMSTHIDYTLYMKK